MAAQKRTARAKTPKAPQKVCEQNPLSWLYTNPQGSSDGFTFGVLRKTFRGRENSAHEFGWRKCHVGAHIDVKDRSIWSPNVEKVEVILPPRADDLLSDPDVLLRQADEFVSPTEAGLLTYVSLPLGDVDRIHTGWERARSYAVSLARSRNVASVVILHSPGVIGAPYPLHAHLCIVPKVLTGLGLRHGAFDQELLRDGGQDILGELWKDHLDKCP